MKRDRVYVYTLIAGLMLTSLFAGPAMVQVNGLAIQNRRVMEDASADLTSTALAPAPGPGPGPIVRDTTLYMIDPETGQTTEIGVTDSIICTGMDFHHGTGVLYAVCSTSQVPKGAEVDNRIFEDDVFLVRINPATGDFTEVGPTGIVPQYGTREVFDVSFRSDGTLFAHLATKGGIILVTINTSTGQFTEVGLLPGELLPGGLAFSADDQLYSADTDANSLMALLHMRDQSGGGGEVAANLNVPFEGTEVPYILSMDRNPGDGIIYGFLTDGQNFIIVRDEAQQRLLVESNYLVTIDPATGDVDLRAPLDIDLLFTAIAIRQVATPANVPTIDKCGLIGLLGLMLAGAFLVLRRRYRSSVA